MKPRRRQFTRQQQKGQDIWKPGVDMPRPKLLSAAIALLGDEHSKRYSTGYLTVRDDERNTVSFAFGEEVMRTDQWGIISEPQTPPHRSASVRRYHEVKQSISESTKPFVTVIEDHASAAVAIKKKLSKKERRKENKFESIDREHTPLVVYGKKPTKFEVMMDKSKMLSSIVSSLKSLPIHPKPRVLPNRDWDRRGEASTFLLDWKPANVSQWAEEQTSQYAEHEVFALTSQQLKDLQGKSTDTIIYANAVYNVPPPTPCGSDVGSLCGDKEDEGEIFRRSEDGRASKCNYLHKDLRNLLGPYSGFHIASGTSNADEIFEENNRSFYYREPFIERGVDPNAELMSFVNRVDIEFQQADAKTSGSYEYEVENHRDDSSHYSRTQPNFQRPRSQNPGQVLIIYLLFKGKPISRVAEMLGPLEETFLYKHESRWFKDFRIPQHTQLNDTIVEKILEVAKGLKLWWEEEYDDQGNSMPKDQVLIHNRQRERRVIRFAKRSVENYLWWRLTGEQPHKDIKSGTMMRKGEY